MAVASAGPYASLHLAPDRKPHQLVQLKLSYFHNVDLFFSMFLALYACCLICRSLLIGVIISVDYKISLWGLAEVSKHYCIHAITVSSCNEIMVF